MPVEQHLALGKGGPDACLRIHFYTDDGGREVRDCARRATQNKSGSSIKSIRSIRLQSMDTARFFLSNGSMAASDSTVRRIVHRRRSIRHMDSDPEQFLRVSNER